MKANDSPHHQGAPLYRSRTSLSPEDEQELLFQGCSVVVEKPFLTKVVSVIDNRTAADVNLLESFTDPQRELERLQVASSASDQVLERLLKKLSSDGEHVAADIIFIQRALLHDPYFQGVMKERIVNFQESVEKAITHTLFHVRHVFSKIGNGYFAQRYEDIEDVLQRMLCMLNNDKKEKNHELIEYGLSRFLDDLPGVIIAFSIPPSIATEVGRHAVDGLVTAEGGTLSHTAVIMKSRGIPYITGVSYKILTEAHLGDAILLDPMEGLVILRPTYERVQRYLAAENPLRVSQTSSQLPSGKKRRRIEFQATVHHCEDVAAAVGHKADAIGLFRSEYLAFREGKLPSFDVQVTEYRALLEAAQGRIFTFRTFDFSSDKEFFFFGREEFLQGVLLKKPIYRTVLQEQLLAILTSSKDAPIRILFPMISCREEVDLCRELFQDVFERFQSKEARRCQRPQIGVMVELPLTSVTFPSFRGAIDFVALGTNDLLHHSLAIDRAGRRSHLADIQFLASHVGFLHIVDNIIKKSKESELPLSVCGEMASDPFFLPLFIGFGARSFSVPPKFLEKARLLALLHDEKKLQRIARKVLASSSSQEIVATLQDLLLSSS